MDNLASVLRLAAPLLIAVVSAHIFARIRLFNVALESTIVAGAVAFSIAWVVVVTELGWAGWPGFLAAMLIAALVGASLGAIFATVVIVLRIDPVVAGVALGMIVAGGLSWADASMLPDIAVLAKRIAFGPKPQELGVWFFWFGCLVSVFVAGCFRLNPAARHAFATGLDEDGEEAGRQVGIRIGALRIWVAGCAGCVAAIAGVSIAAMSTGSVRPGIGAGRGYIALAIALLWNRSLFAGVTATMAIALLDAPFLKQIVEKQMGIPEGFKPTNLIVTLPYWALLGLLAVPALVRLLHQKVFRK